MTEYVQNFKIIVALKSEKDSKLGSVKCTISIQDKVKTTVLPQSEGQFFDINELTSSNPIIVYFELLDSGKKIGELIIPIPKDVYQEKEVEMADQFSVEFQGEQGIERFNGRYYIIVLNKGEVKVEREQFTETVEERAHQQIQDNHQARLGESTNTKFIQSTGERSHERHKKDQTKKLLAETKFDPKPVNKKLPQSQKDSKDQNKSMTFSSKKSQGSTRQINKNSSTKQIENPNVSNSNKKDQNSLTPQQVHHKTENNVDDSVEHIRPTQRHSSPFSRYKGKSQQLTYSELESELDYNKSLVKDHLLQTNRNEGNREVNERLEHDLLESESKRASLQELVREGIQDGVKFREETEKKISELVQENLKLQKKVKYQIEKNNEQENDLDNKNQIIRELEQSNKDVQRKLQNQDEMRRICETQQTKLEDQDQRIKDNQKVFQDKIKALISATNKLEGQHNQLLGEKADVDHTIKDLRAQLQKQAEFKQLEKQLEAQQTRNNELKQHIEQLKNDLLGLGESKDNSHSFDQEKIQALKEVIKGQDGRIKEQDSLIRQLQKQILSLKEQIAGLLIGTQLTQEIIKQCEALKKQNQALQEDNSNLVQLIEDLTDSLQATNNQILELRAEVLHQTSLQEEAENHNNNLKRLILEMRERGIAYIAMKEDKIDQTLAFFINNRQDADRQRQLFVREGEGVYQFGSKKIYIKVEQDKIFIRSGGGFISIEDFLNLYSQREMDTIMRGDPLAALQRNKAALRKRDEMKLVHQIKDEQMSPLKRKGTQIAD